MSAKEDSVMHHRLIAALFVAACTILSSVVATAHPLGNFSISQYSGIRIGKDTVEIRYIIDMAEIPTFQEIQESGVAPAAADASLQRYLARKAELLRDGLSLRLGGKPLALQIDSTDIIFPPGAGGLPTMKIGILFKASLDGDSASGGQSLDFRDSNFPGRAGWKEIVAVADAGVILIDSSIPRSDRSRQLSDYPMDLLNSPPQQLNARVSFKAGVVSTPAVLAERSLSLAKDMAQTNQMMRAGLKKANVPPTSSENWPAEKTPQLITEVGLANSSSDSLIQLKANRQSTPRDSFTELLATKQVGLGIILIALAVAVGLGAFHALEPGHGKTLVAAYLVGSRGTAKQAFLLGLIVTAAHTAGVYLLGAVTLYASRYVVPERLYPWLGVVSGAMIAGLGLVLLVRRYLGKDEFLTHTQHHHAAHAHGADGHHHHHHGHEHHHHQQGRPVSLRELLTLGISGGIVPCPAALVVLLSAVSLHRIGLGLLLIVAFSVGLAAVLIAVGMLMIHARQLMSRFHGDGRLTTRWLPLASSVFITLFGVALTAQAIQKAGWVAFRL
jgi:ABC-type nickel/cobalt efflux system permease component RcnA